MLETILPASDRHCGQGAAQGSSLQPGHRGIATPATSGADESRGDDGRRQERHTLETAREFFIVNSSRINLSVMRAR